jgi:hypothetical protein
MRAAAAANGRKDMARAAQTAWMSLLRPTCVFIAKSLGARRASSAPISRCNASRSWRAILQRLIGELSETSVIQHHARSRKAHLARLGVVLHDADNSPRGRRESGRESVDGSDVRQPRGGQHSLQHREVLRSIAARHHLASKDGLARRLAWGVGSP